MPKGVGGVTTYISSRTKNKPIDLHVLANLRYLQAMVAWPMIALPNTDPSSSIIGDDRVYSKD